MSSLSVKNLRIHNPTGIPLVNGLSFNLGAGERVGILGESGSGKSLTALAISGLLGSNLNAEGSIEFGGAELLGMSESEFCKVRGSGIGIVFQDPLSALDPVMKIGKQLAKPLKRYRGLRGDALRAEIEAALAEVKITSPVRVARSYPHEISGGERQRVALALVLACRPRILIADEITTSLDVSVQAEILTLLNSVIVDRGMGLIFISHDIAVAYQIVDEIILLKSGELIESGKFAELLRAPQSSYLKELIRSARSLESLFSAITPEESK
jgi:peptide/nickel transport system ATP-binding protein